jgi:transcriptional regulator with XRE-family HTH domain
VSQLPVSVLQRARDGRRMSGWLSPEQTRILAENVFRLRAERNWTQDQLSELSGVHVTTIRQLQAGRTSVQEGTLAKLTAAFGFGDDEDILLRPYVPPSAPPPPVSYARQVFNHEEKELVKMAEELGSDVVWKQLAARLRTLTAAVRAERRRVNGG